MQRRNFLHLIAAFLTPPAVVASAPPGIFPHPDHFPAADLDAWLRLPMQPILRPGDLPESATDVEQRVGGILLTHLQEIKTALEITYHGGSSPGLHRRIHPILLFRKFEPAVDSDSPLPIYLLARCETRKAPRTFRLDRISLRKDSHFRV